MEGVFHGYRALLRGARASVRFSSAASRNLRRLLRNEGERLVSEGTLAPEVRSHTSAFFLASAYSPRRRAGPAGEGWTAKRTTLAHRVVFNLASLTYHHLSPHTRMQPLSVRRITADSRPRSVNSLARFLGRIDSDSLSDSDFKEGDVTINAPADKVRLLNVYPKPVRGPVGSKLPHWDAQNYHKRQSSGVTKGSGAAGNSALPLAEADFATLQRTSDNLEAKKQSIRNQAIQTAIMIRQCEEADQQQEVLRKQMVELEKKIRGFRRSKAKQDKIEYVNAIPVEMMAEVVGMAQINEQMLLGKTRWDIKRSGGWLAS